MGTSTTLVVWPSFELAARASDVVLATVRPSYVELARREGGGRSVGVGTLMVQLSRCVDELCVSEMWLEAQLRPAPSSYKV